MSDYPFYGQVAKPSRHAIRPVWSHKKASVTDRSSKPSVSEAVFRILKRARGPFDGFGQHPLRVIR